MTWGRAPQISEHHCSLQRVQTSGVRVRCARHPDPRRRRPTRCRCHHGNRRTEDRPSAMLLAHERVGGPGSRPGTSIATSAEDVRRGTRAGSARRERERRNRGSRARWWVHAVEMVGLAHGFACLGENSPNAGRNHAPARNNARPPHTGIEIDTEVARAASSHGLVPTANLAPARPLGVNTICTVIASQFRVGVVARRSAHEQFGGRFRRRKNAVVESLGFRPLRSGRRISPPARVSGGAPPFAHVFVRRSSCLRTIGGRRPIARWNRRGNTT